MMHNLGTDRPPHKDATTQRSNKEPGRFFTYHIWQRVARSPLALILFAFVCNTTLWASIVEPGHPPDELLHFDYIRYIATYRTLPVFGEARYFFNPAYVQAHAMLPPLYYLFGVPLLILLDNQSPVLQLYAARGISLAIGTITVAAAYGTGRLLVPTRPLVAIAVAALVAFNPMFTYMSGAVNSDNLVTTVSSTIFLVLAWGIRTQRPGKTWQILLGILIGTGLLAKPTIATAVVASGWTLIWLAWNHPGHRWRTFFAYTARIGGIALIISGWHYIRNWLLYGDPTGLSLIGTRYKDSFSTRPYHERGTVLDMLFEQQQEPTPFLQTLFKGFWGYFDHLEVQMPSHIYTLLLILCIGSIIGILLALIQRAQARQLTSHPLMLTSIGTIYITLALVLVITACYRIDYQPQGRYLFSALVPVMLLMVIGWEHLAGVLNLRRFVAPLLLLLILGINAIALTTAVLPTHIKRHIHQIIGVSRIPNLAPIPQTMQLVYGPYETHTNFVAEYAQIDQIDVVLYRTPGFSDPIIWRLSQQDTTILSATSYGIPSKLSRISITIPSTIRFAPGSTYTLSIDAPWAPADKPLLALFPETPYAHSHPAASSELNIRVRYAGQTGTTMLYDISRVLFSDTLHSPRTHIQMVLYPLVIILFGLLAFSAMRKITPIFWQTGVWILLVVGIVVLLATSQGIAPTIPEHRVAGTAGSLLVLDNAKEDVYADLLLLSDSPEATKHPPDQPDQQSMIQPLFFHMHDTTWPVLFMHPTSAITYALHIPASAYIETAIALNPVVWEEQAGDGVEFAVSITAQNENERHKILRHTLDPINTPEQRTWNEVVLDLHAYANQDVLLCLETSPGPAGNVQFDWAGWREPAIVVR